QRGRIRIIQNGNLLGTDFLDLTGIVSPSGSERGLLGMAFDPDYQNNRRFYVNFTNTSGNTVIARFKRSVNDPLRADPSSRFDFLFGTNRFIIQDFSNHNGGTLMFGPDGYLYIGMGDGGSGGDPNNRAQSPNSWLGKMLRLDVNVSDTDNVGYRVPPDNPFLDGDPISALGEIWAFGLRNPWKFSFDSPQMGGTGALVIADVGQNSWEEINYEPADRGGRNYGWSIREGRHPYN
ncbi:MAG: glucose dehydrogenase, partial [Armatimonadota bacterium]